MAISRLEHPKPQWQRDTWQNLNGEWQFEFDMNLCGLDNGFYKPEKKFSKTINVPFCPESELSGIGFTDYMNAVWYKKTVNIKKSGNRIRLHIGAADYTTVLFVNGSRVGEHSGGYISFYFDITDYTVNGDNEICIFCRDTSRYNRFQPTGKQCPRLKSSSCFYTRTTGIWQTVWLEFLPETHIESVKIRPQIASCSAFLEFNLAGNADLQIKAFYEGKPVGEKCIKNAGGIVNTEMVLSELHLWETGHGRLYDVELTFGADTVKTYFGLREISIKGKKVLINGKPVFQRLVLDQGYYPDGIYTAPSDEALKKDILLGLNAGFNGARLHEKIFEERYLYHADKLGYLVWGEYPDWGLGNNNPEQIYSFLPEWMAEIERDFNHPSIIGWCPRNETWDNNCMRQFDPCIELVYDITKQLDNTRPCIDTSGGFHVKTDIYCTHDYEHNPDVFAATYKPLLEGNVPDAADWRIGNHERQRYNGQPVMVSEYGGITFKAEGTEWGYGNGITDDNEFLKMFGDLANVLMDNIEIFGLCYTQLTDVEQEQNGIYKYNRTEKIAPEKIKAILSRVAEYEKE